jgi:hypothetical protein
MNRDRTSSHSSDVEDVLAALQLQDATPNIDKITGALCRRLNLGAEDSGDESVRAMAAALMKCLLKEKRGQDEAGACKENETGHTPSSVSGEATSSPFTETTPAVSNTTPTVSKTTPVSFARHKTPSTRDRTPSRSRSADNPTQVFEKMDVNKGGYVLFDEF